MMDQFKSNLFHLRSHPIDSTVTILKTLSFMSLQDQILTDEIKELRQKVSGIWFCSFRFN